jgi:hypothetical protein
MRFMNKVLYGTTLLFGMLSAAGMGANIVVILYLHGSFLNVASGIFCGFAASFAAIVAARAFWTDGYIARGSLLYKG